MFALALGLSVLPGFAHADESEDRGEPDTVTPLAHWDAARVADYLEGFGLDRSHVKFGLDAYRVEYFTVSTSGTLTIASSLVAVPRNGPRELQLAVWLHGTTVYKGDAASVNDESDDRAATFMLAAAGYVTTAPDYLGLGEGPGTHPYDDRGSEVSASLDALRATAKLAEWLQRRVDPRVSIAGFSQGGASSLALARAIEQGEARRFKVRAIAPIGGPYDMSGTLATAVAGGIEHTTAYLAYLTVSWNRLHYLYASPSDAFLPPYDRTIESLFDNTHPAEEVLTSLPDTLDALFTPQYLALLAAPSGALADALAAADSVCDWTPSVETVLYTSQNDRDVPIANARTCESALLARGAAARVVDFKEPDHAGTFIQAMPLVIEQFDARR